MSAVLTPCRRGVHLFDSFRREREDLFDRFVGDGPQAGPFAAWAPRVDVEETEKEFVVKADLLGVDPKDVDIQVVDDVLTLRGGKEESKEERKNYHRIERFSGQIYRSIGLPAGADADKVTATNGTVTVTIPKRPGAQPKKIAVEPKG